MKDKKNQTTRKSSFKKSADKKSTAKKVVCKKVARVQSVAPNDLPKSVRECWENMDWGALSDHFGDRTLQRGRDYAKYKNVQSLWTTEDGKNLLAVVIGTDEYNTLVVLEEGKRKNDFALFTDCSCPVGSGCKHAVATIVCFLDYFANNKPIPLCRELDDDTWEVIMENGKTKTMKIDEYIDDDDWDDDEYDGNWEDDEDDYDDEPPKPSRKIPTSKTSSKKDDPAPSLEEKLKGKSQKELAAMVLRLSKEHDSVREQFEQEAFAETVAKSGDIAKLVEKAIKLIDKEVNVTSHGYGRYRYDDSPNLELDTVVEIVKQFGKFDDALVAVDRVSKHLIKKGTKFVEETGAEDTYDIDQVFEAMAKTLLASKTPPVSIILWAYEVFRLCEYDFGGSELKTLIFDRKWSVKVWSGVADALLTQLYKDAPTNRSYWLLRTIVETLDKANRQKEATDLLRKEAGLAKEHMMLVDRLIEFGFLDEAEKIAWEQRQLEFKSERNTGFYRGTWSERLKTLAEKRKNYPMQASIEAAEFFFNPSDHTILPLLQIAKKMKVEPEVRRAIESFLQTGELPAVIQKGLAGAKPTTKEHQDFPIPFYAFQGAEKKQKPRFDVLCDWAIAEKRPNHVVLWFDEHSKQKDKVRTISREKVADAIADTHADRALQIYRDLAEHEMEITRSYPSAVRILRKVRKVFENQGRVADWSSVMLGIRTRHKAKTSLMKQLNELEAGSIVKQKRGGK